MWDMEMQENMKKNINVIWCEKASHSIHISGEADMMGDMCVDILLHQLTIQSAHFILVIYSVPVQWDPSKPSSGVWATHMATMYWYLVTCRISMAMSIFRDKLLHVHSIV